MIKKRKDDNIVDIKEILNEINKTDDIKELEKLLFALTVIKKEVASRRTKLIMKNVIAQI